MATNNASRIALNRIIHRDDTMFAGSNHSEPGREHNTNSRLYGNSSTVTSQELSSEKSEAVETQSLRPKKEKEFFQSLEMTTKMKGLLKGLRYISQIFDNGKEQEMQIGNPTDVKHVAHIGWDGPSVHSPSWMNEYRATPEFSSAPLSTTANASESNEQDLHRTGAGIDGSVHRDMVELPKPSRRPPSTGTPSTLDSPSPDQPRQRRHQSTTGISISSPSRDVTTEGSTRTSRRSQNSGLSIDSSLQDQPVDPKKSRRKKSNKGDKGVSGGGSTRPSRSKAQSATTYTSPHSDPGSGSARVLDNGICPTSPLKPRGDGKGGGNHGIS